ncbi:MAG: hypothetical protein ABR502_09060 [Chitinophagaceae bacterium]
MQENLKDILSHLSTNVDQETLLLYLQGKLSAEKQHEVEKQILESDFASDAVEGLQKLKDEQRIALIVAQLNKELKKKTQKRKSQKDKLKLHTQPWLLITIVIILLLILVSYFIIHRLQQ